MPPTFCELAQRACNLSAIVEPSAHILKNTADCPVYKQSLNCSKYLSGDRCLEL